MNVLKKIILAVMLSAGSLICSAQEINIQGGLNLSEFRYTNGDGVYWLKNVKLNPGFNAGAMLDVPIKNMFSLATGILLSSKGVKISDDETLEGEYLHRENLFYFDISVLCKITMPVKKVKIFAMAGPYWGQALSGKSKQGVIVNSVHKEFEAKIHWGDQYHRFDYGAKTGIGLRYKKYQIGASYEFGFKNLSAASELTRKNRVLELYISYALINLKSNKK
ncbi:MAG TPA: porin family protein [Sunxiuqinia sp.]|nr:porin family protein [Sunxiuqinia sp.]